MKHFLTTIFLLITFAVSAQRKTWRISTDFPEMSHANRDKVLADFGTVAQNSTKYPALYSWWKSVLGQTDATFQQITIASAVLNQACWSGHGGGFTPGVLCTSRNNVIDIPGGYYSVNVGITLPLGRFIGSGTAIGTGGPPLWNVNASTEFVYDHARWIDPRPVRAVVLTGNYGMSSYYESFYIDAFRVSGNSPLNYDPSYTQHGIVLTGMGEGSIVGNIEVNTCNGHGVWVTGAGPGRIDYLSSFDNQMAGLCFGQEKPGTQKGLGTLDVGFLSCDNNVWACQNNGGGSMTIGFLKNEDGLSVSRGRPKKGQVVYEVHGWSDTHIVKVHDAVTGASPAAFVVNTLANTSRIKVDSYVQVANNADVNSGRSALLMLPRSQEVWRTADANGMKLDPISFEWKGIGTSSGTFTCSTPMVKQASPAQTRLGLSSTYAGYNYATGTPVLDLTFGGTPPPPPPPPVCTWQAQPETCSTCVSNSQTCTITYLSSLAGCTPTTAKPADVVRSQSCGTQPPPPPTGIIATIVGGNVYASATQVVDWKAVKRVVFTNLRVDSDMNYRRLLSLNSTDANGLSLLPDGRWRAPSRVYCTQTPAKLVVGTTYLRVEIVLPTAIDVQHFLAQPGKGNALVYSADKVEFFNQ